MMRSLYSGVAGLKTHQTKMDVLGNNIANVNTVGFKSSAVNFADTFYQMVSPATGASPTPGAAGTNAKQIGLGSSVASITTNITEPGGTSTTNRALDIAINGDAFLIVKQGGSTYFTKSGAMNVDENGTLYCTTNGATVQGWLADADGNVVKDSVRDLRVMSAENMYYPPTATGDITMTGNIDKNDKNLVVTGSTKDAAAVVTDDGHPMTFSFYDELGEMYSVKLFVYSSPSENDAGTDTSAATTAYRVTVADVYREDGSSIFVSKSESTDTDSGVTTTSYAATGVKVKLGGVEYEVDGTPDVNTGKFKLKADGDRTALLKFVAETGEFSGVVEQGVTRPATSKYLGKALLFEVSDAGTLDDTFTNYNETSETGGVELDFSGLTQYSNGGVANTSYTWGDADGLGAGNSVGQMSGISIDSNGFIYGDYDNGAKKCLGQIAVTTFANPSGLEAVGDSLFAESLNSGSFDGVGTEVSLSGGFTVGALEMSNVDLASEFTNMITTQRGFQANSRIITTSDSMLEELVNLKR